MISSFTRSAVAAALAAAAAAPALAAAPAADFESRLAAAIDRAMAAPASIDREPARGIATVRFTLDRDGRPAEIAIVETSGSRALDRAALRTVERLDLPAGSPAGPHLAVLQYDTTLGEAQSALAAARLQGSVTRAQLALRDLRPAERLAGGGGVPAAIAADD